MKIHFYGLLHIADNDININFKPKTNDEKVKIYIKNSELLAKSLYEDNIDYTLLTNNKKELNRIHKSSILKIKEIDFKTSIIKGSHFYPCYYRIDVFNFLSKQKNQFSFLIDLDIVLIRSVITKIRKLANKKNVLVNDITNLILPAYGFKRINFEFSLLKRKKWKKKWYGADFLAGPDIFFKDLHKFIKPLYKKFQENFEELKNQGDELFMSSAIEEIIETKKFKIIDARSKKIIGRYWSVPRKHRQESFEEIFRNNMVHFLADKKFLAEYNIDNFSKNKFIYDFKKYNFSIIKKFKGTTSLLYNKFIKSNKLYY
jgi:hypothetical protein